MRTPRPHRRVFDTPVSRLDFAGMLAALQALLGSELDVMVYLPGGGFTTGFRGQLLRVVELPPDREAVTLQFEGREAVTLAPEEVAIFCGGAEREGEQTRWIEVQVRGGLCLLIEEAARGDALDLAL